MLSKRQPWLSLWESWLGAAETERALRRFYNENVHWYPQRWPSPSELRSATSPIGRGKGTFLRIRPLFPQCFMLYRIPSSVRAMPCQLPPREAFLPCRAAILGWKGFSWAGENENHKARNACKPGTSGSPEGGKIREKGAKRGDLRRSGRRTGFCAMCLNLMFQKCE